MIDYEKESDDKHGVFLFSAFHVAEVLENALSEHVVACLTPPLREPLLRVSGRSNIKVAEFSEHGLRMQGRLVEIEFSCFLHPSGAAAAVCVDKPGAGSLHLHVFVSLALPISWLSISVKCSGNCHSIKAFSVAVSLILRLSTRNIQRNIHTAHSRAMTAAEAAFSTRGRGIVYMFHVSLITRSANGPNWVSSTRPSNDCADAGNAFATLRQ